MNDPPEGGSRPSRPVPPTPPPVIAPIRSPGISAWRFVVSFGVVSLLMDVVYEGARSVTGPLLLGLGASAATVGFVTGAGEAAALGLRLVSGPLADRTGRFWALTIGGYALTAASVPLLGFSAVLWVACALVIVERVGKAIRSPAKDTLLSHATSVTGRGRGFAVHEAIDQIGAVLGPLTVAAVLALTGDDYGPALAVLAFPALIALGLLVQLRRRVPNPVDFERQAHSSPATAPRDPSGLPAAFWWHVAFTAVTTAGLATFGVLSFHMVDRDLVPIAAVPLIYAVVMGVDAIAALITGLLYDRAGAHVLTALPLLSSTVALLSFTTHRSLVVLGAVAWGAALGIQESTLRAYVADTVLPGARATAYGIYAGVLGGATLIGGVLTGVLYTASIPALVITVVVMQVAALILLRRGAQAAVSGH